MTHEDSSWQTWQSCTARRPCAVELQPGRLDDKRAGQRAPATALPRSQGSGGEGAQPPVPGESTSPNHRAEACTTNRGQRAALKAAALP